MSRAMPQELLMMAGQLARQAEEVRQRADALVREAESVRWQSMAAAAMVQWARTSGAQLRAVAGRYDDAAVALRRHAEAVELSLAAIDAAAAAGAAAVGSAVGAVVDAASGVALDTQ